MKKLSLDNIKIFRDRFDIPVKDEEIENLPYVRPKEDSAEIKYLKEAREKLGGPIPRRRRHKEVLKLENHDAFKVIHDGSGDRKVSTLLIAFE